VFLHSVCNFYFKSFGLIMAINYSVLNYTVNVLVEKTMKRYDCDYQSALQAVLNSKMYERLITDADFLDEGDIFLFNILSKELDAK